MPVLTKVANSTIFPTPSIETGAPCVTLPPCASVNTTCGDIKGAYDYDGAMKFTVAVVLVYGIGVIGLLGIYTKRKRIVEDKVKEGTTFVKTFEQKRMLIERKARKSAVSKLVQSIHEGKATPNTSSSGTMARACLFNIALSPLMGSDVAAKEPRDVETTNEGAAENLLNSSCVETEIKGHSCNMEDSCVVQTDNDCPCNGVCNCNADSVFNDTEDISLDGTVTKFVCQNTNDSDDKRVPKCGVRKKYLITHKYGDRTISRGNSSKGNLLKPITDNTDVVTGTTSNILLDAVLPSIPENTFIV